MKNYIINAIVALLLIIGVGALGYPTAKITPQQSNDPSLSGLSERDVKAVTLNVTGNSTLGGIVTSGKTLTMTNATSTPCAFLSPSATSTLRYFSAYVASSTAVTSTTYVLATSTTPYATSSLITRFGTAATGAVPAGSKATLSWGIGDTNMIVNPSTYVVLGVQGGTGNFGTAAQVGGNCKAQFTIL
jgi:hypothetical protein